MKKRIAMLMLAAMLVVLALAGCGSKKEASPVVGDWKVTTIEMAGTTVSVDDYLAATGSDAIKMEFSIKEDGKFSMDMAGQTADGTWKYKEPTLTLTVEGDPLDTEYKDGKIIMDMDGVVLTLERK